MSRRILIPITTTLFLAFTLWSYDFISDRRYQLEIVKPTLLLTLSPTEYPISNPPLIMLQPGQPVKVLRMLYGKDFQTFKIETSSGEIGWVVRGEGIWVLSSG